MFVVGKDLPQRAPDEDLAKFCKKNECDLITKDGTAYIRFLAVNVKTVQISELFYETCKNYKLESSIKDDQVLI